MSWFTCCHSSKCFWLFEWQTKGLHYNTLDRDAERCCATKLRPCMSKTGPTNLQPCTQHIFPVTHFLCNKDPYVMMCRKWTRFCDHLSWRNVCSIRLFHPWWFLPKVFSICVTNMIQSLKHFCLVCQETIVHHDLEWSLAAQNTIVITAAFSFVTVILS